MEDRALEITQKNPPSQDHHHHDGGHHSPDSSPFPSQQQQQSQPLSSQLPSDSQPPPTQFYVTPKLKDEVLGDDMEEDDERSMQSHDPIELCCIDGCHRVHSNHTYTELAGQLRGGPNSLKMCRTHYIEGLGQCCVKDCTVKATNRNWKAGMATIFSLKKEYANRPKSKLKVCTDHNAQYSAVLSWRQKSKKRKKTTKRPDDKRKQRKMGSEELEFITNTLENRNEAMMVGSPSDLSDDESDTSESSEALMSSSSSSSSSASSQSEDEDKEKKEAEDLLHEVTQLQRHHLLHSEDASDGVGAPFATPITSTPTTTTTATPPFLPGTPPTVTAATTATTATATPTITTTPPAAATTSHPRVKFAPDPLRSRKGRLSADSSDEGKHEVPHLHHRRGKAPRSIRRRHGGATSTTMKATAALSEDSLQESIVLLRREMGEVKTQMLDLHKQLKQEMNERIGALKDEFLPLIKLQLEQAHQREMIQLQLLAQQHSLGTGNA